MSKFTKGAKELFGIAKDLAKGKDISVPDEVFNERYEICKKCPKLSNLGFCGICGCAMSLKCKVATSSCPDNPPKWREYKNETSPST
jgi:hypothetical protein